MSGNFHGELIANRPLKSGYFQADFKVPEIVRTARAGQKGLALSLVCHGEAETLAAIRTLTGRALPLEELEGFPVTDQPASGEGKRAPRDKQANRRTQAKRSVRQFKGKA